MQQTRIVIEESGRVSCKRPRLNVDENSVRQSQEDQIWLKIRQLQVEIELLKKRVRELENAKVEFVDLTADDSFPSTVSVLSDDLDDSDIPNGI